MRCFPVNEPYPRVTDIISKNLGWNKEPLMRWANRCGLDSKHYHDVSAAAARAGALCHAMIDAHLRGAFYDTSSCDADTLLKVRSGFDNFLAWRTTVTLLPLFTETRLVSERHRYCGTVDYVGSVNGQLSIVDWKTSDRVYPEMLLQLAAYGNLWEQNYPDKPLTGGFHLLCVSKETASFSHHHWETLPGAMEAFLHLLALHELQPALKGL